MRSVMLCISFMHSSNSLSVSFCLSVSVLSSSSRFRATSFSSSFSRLSPRVHCSKGEMLPYFESQNQTAKPHFSDRQTHLTETLDYAQFSLRVEKLKTSFKTVYGILDKIAYFLNSYFDLGINEKDITFSSVWRSEKGGKNGYAYKHVLNIENNFPLASLYWISQDFDEKIGEYFNPELKRLREIRNFLEHKYTIIAWNYKDDDPFQNHPAALYLDEDELTERTLELFKIVREAILCLALCVNVEERRKREKLSDDTMITKMQLGIHKDSWKI